MPAPEAALALEELLHPQKHQGIGQQLSRLMAFLGANPVPKTAQPVRVGVLGASQVATYALIWPARRLPDVQVAAVAARDSRRAAAFAKQHGIPASYGSYQELIDDPALDAIYVATPNGLHGAWAAAALRAGKHVLCEKPFAANAREARDVQDVAARSRRPLLCREAFHYREHPANQAVARLLQGGAIGQVQVLQARVLIPAWLFSEAKDIRFKASLAGGTAMDAGCYGVHVLRFVAGASSRSAAPRVVAASASKLLDGGQIDGCIRARIAFPGGSGSSSSVLALGAEGVLQADLRHGGLWPSTQLEVVGTKGRLVLDNFIEPSLGHSIRLTRLVSDPRSCDNPDAQVGVLGDGLKEVTQRISVYGSGESNYYFQLQRFVSDLRVLEDADAPKEAKRAVRATMRADAEDAVTNMQVIDAIYTAAGLPLRQPTAHWTEPGSPAAAALLPRGTKCGR